MECRYFLIFKNITMAITNIDGVPFLWDDIADSKLLGSLFPRGVLPPSFADGLQGIPNARVPKFPSPIEWSNNNLSELLTTYYQDAKIKTVSKNLRIHYYPNSTPTVAPTQNIVSGTGNSQNLQEEDSTWDEFIKGYDTILNAIKPKTDVKRTDGVLYQVKSNNNKYDKDFDVKLLDVTIFVSRDGAALLQQWKSLTTLDDNQLVLFLELNSGDIFSDTVMLSRGGKNVIKYAEDKTLYSYINKNANTISEKQFKELLEATAIGNKTLLDKIINFASNLIDNVENMLDEYWTPLWEYLGNQINTSLRIKEEIWNSQNPENTVKKLIDELTALRKELDNIANKGVTFKVKINNTEISVTLNVLPQLIKSVLFRFSKFLQDVITFIQKGNIILAFCCGFWNGLVDLLACICFLFSMLHDALVTYRMYENNKDYYKSLLEEYKDNLLQGLLFINWFKVAKYVYEKSIEIGKDIIKAVSDFKITKEELAYYLGYIISQVVEVTFAPLKIARLAKLEKVEAVLVKFQQIINKAVAPIEKVVANILEVFFKLVGDFVKLIQKGADEIIKFFDELIEKLKSLLKSGKTFGRITTAIMKEELTEVFMATLRKLGKTDEKIIKYFTDYHNDNEFKFLNEIQKLLKIYPELTKDEAFALWCYTTDFIYDSFNLWMREEINVNRTKAFTDLLLSALKKMPKYNGTVYRAIKISEKELPNFLKNYVEGEPIRYNEFLSCGSNKNAAFFDKPSKNVKIEIHSLKDVPIISDFADGIKFRGYSKDELLILNGMEFKVLKVDVDGINVNIILKQE